MQITDEHIIDRLVENSNHKEIHPAKDGSDIIEYEMISHRRAIKFARALLADAAIAAQGQPQPVAVPEAVKMALSRMAGSRAGDGTSSLVSREDRDIILGWAHSLAAASQPPTVNDLTIRMLEGWQALQKIIERLPDGRFDWNQSTDELKFRVLCLEKDIRDIATVALAKMDRASPAPANGGEHG